MSCDTGAHGSPPLDKTDWVAELWSGAGDNPIEFALFGLARQNEFPVWRQVQWDKPVLDLGPGSKMIHGAIRCEYPEYNFESPAFLPMSYTGDEGVKDEYSRYRCHLPWNDNSIGGIYAVNILEHLWDPRPIMEECARVLAPGAPFNIVVPHGSHGIYLQDLDHKKPFILDSWKNWLENGYWGPDRSALRLRIGVNFKFGIKEENVNIMTQLIKSDDPWAEPGQVRTISDEESWMDQTRAKS